MESFAAGAMGAIVVLAIVGVLILWYNEPKY